MLQPRHAAGQKEGAAGDVLGVVLFGRHGQIGEGARVKNLGEMKGGNGTPLIPMPTAAAAAAAAALGFRKEELLPSPARATNGCSVDPWLKEPAHHGVGHTA